MGRGYDGSNTVGVKGPDGGRDWTFEDVRPVVLGRDRGRCLRCGAWLRSAVWPGMAVHHRCGRNRAGRVWRHCPANCVSLCGQDNSLGCHGWVHRHPELAHEQGYYLRSWEDPREVPVVDWLGRVLMLDDVGGYRVVGRAREGAGDHE